MADKNFNQGNQSHQDWERERKRSNQENDWSYGNAGYSSQQNRANYFPDNDDNRNYNNRDFEDNQHGTSGTYGNRASGMDHNSGNYRNENRGSYGNAGNDYGQSDWNRHRNSGNSYGNEGGFGQRNQHQSGTGNQGSDYGRQDWGRSNVNAGYGNQQDYGNRGYGNTGNDYNRGDWDRNRNQYGGYGNANQGGMVNEWWEKAKDKMSSWFGGEDEDDRRRDYTSSHRGKGPSDYRRSQDRIKEDICDRLTDDHRVDASHIRVQIEEDVVILSGTVNSREEKRRAEDLVESVSGVRDVENRLRVARSSGLSSHNYTGTKDKTGGIGTESGTTNELIRNEGLDRKSGS